MKQCPAASSQGKIITHLCALCLLVTVVLACNLSSLTTNKANMFEGTNAQEAAAKVKEKIGADAVKVSRMEIHADKFEITVQDPKKPKNYDKYTYKGGTLTGPEPVEALVLGEQELTADKMPLFDLSSVNLAAMPEVCRKAVERAQIEEGKVDLISIDWESATHTRSKAEQQKLEEERRKMAPMDRVRAGSSDLAVTWRIWVKGPRMTKYYWADAQGNLSDNQ